MPHPKNTPEIFWSKVDMSNGPESCWLWVGSCTPAGYGQVWFENRPRLAHRLAFFLIYDRWPTLQLCHHCDNPPCCNPRHVFEGTAKDNADDRGMKGRNNPPRGVGHPQTHLTEEDVREIRRLCAAGMPQAKVGLLFGIAQANAGRIARRESWKHIE
jgi:hypothetical protein